MPSGIRLGTPAFTSRGADTKDFETVAAFFEDAIKLTQKLQADSRLGGKKLADFKALLNVSPESGDFKQRFPELAALRTRVVDFARQFPTIGF